MRKTKQEKRVERQLIKIALFVAVLVIVFFVASWVFNKMSKVDYNGLTFTKEKFGNLVFYHYYYYFSTKEGGVNRYNLYLRTDPRFNDIPVYSNIPIIFSGALGQDPIVKVTVDVPSNLNKCPQTFGSIGILSGFLSDNEIDVRSGAMNETTAKEEDVGYVTCDNQKNNQNVYVIQIVSDNETKIDVEGRCHTISVGDDCEILKAVEKYITQSIIDARANP